VFGRIFPNMVADVLGPINVMIPTVVVAAALLFGWLGISTWQGFVVFVILYGFFSGTLVSLPPACVSALTDIHDMSKIGVRMGMMFRYHSRITFINV
jgi:fucose 4-O-acetylase-like acetyltransferase